MHSECRLSIVTINYNGLADTLDLIASIPRDDSIEVVVVDNASAADEASAIERQCPHVRVIRSAENLGFAGGNNLGARAARGRYLFFVNNDTVFRPDTAAANSPEAFMAPLIERLDAADDIGVVCPKIRFAWADNPIQYAGYTPLSAVTLRNRSIGYGEADHGQHDTPHPTPYAHGAAMMVKREALQRAGLMPECYFLYYEELDWSLLFRRAGYTIWYEPRCTIYHKESQSTGQGSPLRTYYITRNRLLFARRNIGRPRRWLTYVWLTAVVATRDIAVHLAHRQTRQARAVLQGLADFCRGRQGRRPSSAP